MQNSYRNFSWAKFTQFETVGMHHPTKCS